MREDLAYHSVNNLHFVSSEGRLEGGRRMREENDESYESAKPLKPYLRSSFQ